MSSSLRKLYSPDDLIQYCLRALGHPVIKIEIDYEQAQDRVYETIQKFMRSHFDGVTESWQPYVLTQTDVDNGYIQFDDTVASIFEIIDLTTGELSSEDFERVNYLIANSEWAKHLTHGSGSGLLDWHLSFMHLELMKQYFSPTMSFSYNETTRRMTINSKAVAGDLIVLNLFKTTDPEEFPEVYNNEWVKRYCTALMGVQWGSNISKYDGVQLPGGVTIRGEAIEQKWRDILQQMDEQFDRRYLIPAAGFMM